MLLEPTFLTGPPKHFHWLSDNENPQEIVVSILKTRRSAGPICCPSRVRKHEAFCALKQSGFINVYLKSKKQRKLCKNLRDFPPDNCIHPLSNHTACIWCDRPFKNSIMQRNQNFYLNVNLDYRREILHVGRN